MQRQSGNRILIFIVKSRFGRLHGEKSWIENFGWKTRILNDRVFGIIIVAFHVPVGPGQLNPRERRVRKPWRHPFVWRWKRGLPVFSPFKKLFVKQTLPQWMSVFVRSLPSLLNAARFLWKRGNHYLESRCISIQIKITVERFISAPFWVRRSTLGRM